jgi:hypothetical protein
LFGLTLDGRVAARFKMCADQGAGRPLPLGTIRGVEAISESKIIKRRLAILPVESGLGSYRHGLFEP